MEEGIARAVRQLDEPKPPLWLKPFDDGAHRRAGRRFEPRCAEAWRGSKFTKMRVIPVVVEIAASGLTEISISDQVSFLSSRFTAQTRPRESIVPKN